MFTLNTLFTYIAKTVMLALIGVLVYLGLCVAIVCSDAGLGIPSYFLVFLGLIFGSALYSITFYSDN